MLLRVKTGVPGLDGILHGGLIKGSNILVTGGPGTGKTVLCAQFIYSGALKHDEPGVFVTVEERPNEMRKEIEQFGWNMKELEEKEKIIIIDVASSKAGLSTDEPWALKRGFDINMLAQEIYKASREIDAQRIVVDSLSGVGIRYEKEAEIREAIFKISALLRQLEVTSIMTTETLTSSTGTVTRYGVEEFISLGVIELFLDEENRELKRSLLIRKMRGTAHSLKRFPFEIRSSGIVVLPGDEF